MEKRYGIGQYLQQFPDLIMFTNTVLSKLREK